MIDHVWTVLCTRGITDKETNNVTLFEVIEQLTLLGPRPAVDQEGIIPTPIEIVTLWTRRNDDVPTSGRCRLRYFRPGSGEVSKATTEIAIDLTLTKRARNTIKINGLSIQEPGRHIFTMDLWEGTSQDWRTVARIPIEVVFSD